MKIHHREREPQMEKPTEKTPYDIIRDPITGGMRTRGCPVCDGTHVVDGKDCPRCFDPARYDVPEDGIPHVCKDGMVIRAVAQVEDVPIWIIPSNGAGFGPNPHGCIDY
jgi:hypothetical protein